MLMAYNLMALFRQFMMQSKTQHTLSTLRHKTFAIGAYFEKVGDQFILKLALNMKRREWFNGLGITKIHSIFPSNSLWVIWDYSTLSNLFSQVEGFTIEQYLILQKTERIKELLVYDELSIQQIAGQLGIAVFSICHAIQERD